MSYLYLIEADAPVRPSLALYKIGITSKPPERRLRQLQTGTPYPLSLVASVRCAHPARLERELHAMFPGRNTSGEWFALTPLELAAVQERARAYAEANPPQEKPAPRARRRKRSDPPPEPASTPALKKEWRRMDDAVRPFQPVLVRINAEEGPDAPPSEYDLYGFEQMSVFGVAVYSCVEIHRSVPIPDGLRTAEQTLAGFTVRSGGWTKPLLA